MRSAKDQVILILRSLSRSRSRVSSWSTKSRSCVPMHQRVEDHEEDDEEKEELLMEDDDDDDDEPCTSLTVWRKSLLLTCSGFTVIDRNGNLAYRVDNYTGRPGEVVLMKGNGKCILTICRRKNLMADDWLVYQGESTSSNHDHEDHNNSRLMMMNCILKRIIGSSKNHHPRDQGLAQQQPVYCVKKKRMKKYVFPSPSTSSSSRRHNQCTTTFGGAVTNKMAAVEILACVYLTNIGLLDSDDDDDGEHPYHRPQKPSATHHVCGGGGRKRSSSSSSRTTSMKKRWPVYVVEGSYSERSCTVWEYVTTNNTTSRRGRSPKVVAEVRRKEAINDGASFGLEIFHLVVKPGFDPDLAMTFILLLDQMYT